MDVSSTDLVNQKLHQAETTHIITQQRRRRNDKTYSDGTMVNIASRR